MSREYGPVWDLSTLFDDADADANYANSTHEGPHLSLEAHAEFVRSSLAGNVGLHCHVSARAVIVDCHQEGAGGTEEGEQKFKWVHIWCPGTMCVRVYLCVCVCVCVCV